MKQKIVIGIIILIFTAGCKQEYIPQVDESQQSLLVVEGNLNPGPDSTIIRLTRTQALDASGIKIESNALLSIEGKDNSIRFLTGRGNGYYVSPNLNLIINNEYRLRIKTANGKEYVSDYVKARVAPAIDSIGWHRNNDGVNIYVNTGDPTDATRYYRWEYVETWEIHSVYGPSVIYENGVIRDRIFPQEDVSVCWKYNLSSSVLITNTTRLVQDIVNEQPLVFIPLGDEKLAFRYSIFVKQYALDVGSYAFYELLKKNTEDIGSFFGPQPSEIKGNLHCVTVPDEFVVGYVTASTVATKRIFITGAEVQWPFRTDCEERRVPNNRDSISSAINLGLMPFAFYCCPPNEYAFSTRECVDCTKRGGSTVKPTYW